MNILAFLFFITTSSATFHKLKPEKIVQTLVEPFVDVALKGIYTGGIIEPIGRFFKTRGKKTRHHHKAKHYPYQYQPDHTHQHEGHHGHHEGHPHYHEREFYYHNGGHSHHPHYGGGHYCGAGYHLGYPGEPFHSLGGEELYHDGYHYEDGFHEDIDHYADHYLR